MERIEMSHQERDWLDCMDSSTVVALLVYEEADRDLATIHDEEGVDDVVEAEGNGLLDQLGLGLI